MKKTYNNDEALKKLIKDEGLLSAPHDLTSRIMSQVEQYNYSIETVYRPLIGTKGWFIIGASVFMLIACCIMIIVSGNYTSEGYLNFLQPFFNFFGNLEISWNINLGSVFIGTMVFISVIIYSRWMLYSILQLSWNKKNHTLTFHDNTSAFFKCISFCFLWVKC